MNVDIKRNEHRESGIGGTRKLPQTREFPALSLGQRCPSHCPQQPGPPAGDHSTSGPASRLGPPLDIKQVALLIGCSPWTVRHKLLPKGLPYFRSGASSKLIFYTDQVVRFIERQQGGQRK